MVPSLVWRPLAVRVRGGLAGRPLPGALPVLDGPPRDLAGSAFLCAHGKVRPSEGAPRRGGIPPAPPQPPPPRPPPPAAAVPGRRGGRGLPGPPRGVRRPWFRPARDDRAERPARAQAGGHDPRDRRRPPSRGDVLVPR